MKAAVDLQRAVDLGIAPFAVELDEFNRDFHARFVVLDEDPTGGTTSQEPRLPGPNRKARRKAAADARRASQ